MKKLRPYLAALVAAFLLSGCSTLAPALVKGAELNDDAVNGAKITLCTAASVGAIEREFNTPEKREARKVLCNLKTSAIE